MDIWGKTFEALSFVKMYLLLFYRIDSYYIEFSTNFLSEIWRHLSWGFQCFQIPKLLLPKIWNSLIIPFFIFNYYFYFLFLSKLSSLSLEACWILSLPTVSWRFTGMCSDTDECASSTLDRSWIFQPGNLGSLN